MSNIKQLLNLENARQFSTISLIASENHSSNDVRQALSSRLTDKYAEGYPNRRYYAGCSLSDQIELYAQQQVCKLFQAKWANVQPHSGSQANQAVYLALLNGNDTILGLSLSHGGHLTHGFHANSSGKLYNGEHYMLKNELLDMNDIEKIAIKCKPKLIIAGASAYSRIIDWQAFSNIAKKVGAYLLADVAHYAGLIAGKAYPNPIQYADVVTFTTHKTLRGPRGGCILGTCDKIRKKIDSAIFPGTQGGPFMNNIAAKAICFEEALSLNFQKYASQVILNAKAMVSVFKKNNIRIISRDTDCHLINLDLTNINISGAEAEAKLEKVGIITNKELIPNDSLPANQTSGLRLGTAAITTRGMLEKQSIEIAEYIISVLKNDKYDVNYVDKLCKQFPLVN